MSRATCSRTQPGCRIDGTADHGEVQALRRPDIAEEDLAAVERDAGAQRAPAREPRERVRCPVAVHSHDKYIRSFNVFAVRSTSEFRLPQSAGMRLSRHSVEATEIAERCETSQRSPIQSFRLIKSKSPV